jgi:hypothetical protein
MSLSENNGTNEMKNSGIQLDAIIPPPGAAKDISPEPQKLTQTRRRNRRGVPPELDGDRMVSADEWAATCGVTKRQFFRWQAAGHVPIPDLSIGQIRRWKLSTLRAWIAAEGKRAS